VLDCPKERTKKKYSLLLLVQVLTKGAIVLISVNDSPGNVSFMGATQKEINMISEVCRKLGKTYREQMTIRFTKSSSPGAAFVEVEPKKQKPLPRSARYRKSRKDGGAGDGETYLRQSESLQKEVIRELREVCGLYDSI